MKRPYQNNEWVMATFPLQGGFTGRLRMCKGEWWFFGDVCRDMKMSLRTLRRKKGRIWRADEL